MAENDFCSVGTRRKSVSPGEDVSILRVDYPKEQQGVSGVRSFDLGARLSFVRMADNGAALGQRVAPQDSVECIYLRNLAALSRIFQKDASLR